MYKLIDYRTDVELEQLKERDEKEKELLKQNIEAQKNQEEERLAMLEFHNNEATDAMAESMTKANDNRARALAEAEGTYGQMEEAAQQNADNLLAIEAQKNAMQRAQDSAQLAYNQMTAQLSQDIIDGKVQSLGDYAAIIGKQLQITLTNIAVESGIQSLWETAQGIAMTAIGNLPSATSHFTAAGTYAATAAAAGLGAVAAGGVAHMGTPAKSGNSGGGGNIETPTGTDTTKTQTAATKALEDKKPIYISEADAKKMAIFAVDAVNKGMMLGRPLEVLRK
jgi:hypothetical protein